MWHVYYPVPQCPSCGSYETGRYVKEAFLYPGWVVEESLRHGEIVRETSTIPESNCFCDACQHKWYHRVSSRWISSKELARQKEMRATEKKYEDYMFEHYPGGKRPKEPAFKRWFL